MILSKQQEVEVNQLRGTMNDRSGAESVHIVKQNEKSSALFSEVVRIGEEQEKTIQNLHSVNADL